eukprot:Gb_14616 [translate_table: standard]
MDNCKYDKMPSIQNPKENMEARFMDFCKGGLSLDEETLKQALHLFKESKHLLLANMGVLGAGSQEENERFWIASVLYAVKRLSGGKSVSKENREENATGFTLSQILRVANLNVVDFLKELPQFCFKASYILNTLYGNDWEKKLQAKEMEANFVHLTVLHKYYKRVFRDCFLCGHHSQDKILEGVSNCPGPLSNYLRFGWMLFLALRTHVFGRYKDLVTCTNGLVSIMVILIMHVPVNFRKFSLDDSTCFVRRSGKGVDLIASLCNIYHTLEEDLLKNIGSVNTLITDILKKKPHPASKCQAKELKDIETDGFNYFEGLMEETSLASSISILEKNYEGAIHDRGELDERMFLNEEDSLFASGSLSGGAINLCGSKRKHEAIYSPTETITRPSSPPLSPTASPAKGSYVSSNVKMLPPTPVSITMTTAKWLRSVIAPVPGEPCRALKQFFASCDRDITQDIIHRANIILQAIFPSSGPEDCCVTGSLWGAALMDSIWAEQRRMEALKLYYRVLAAMCRAESQRLQSSNLTSLLSNERFHRCMLACSSELVLATHKTVTMIFPAVLEPIGITAFDLSKVIESFVRHEETLPRELKRHLNTLEERLLESLAWEKGSSMYNSLIVAKPGLAAEINCLGLLADPMPLLDTIAMHLNPSSKGVQLPPSTQGFRSASDQDLTSPSSPPRQATSLLAASNGTAVGVFGFHSCLVSPAKPHFSASLIPNSKLQPPLQSAFASPQRPSLARGGETCAETGINVFFKKVLKLAAIRIKNLCERLRRPDHFMEQVYRLFQHMLNHETSLFFNRHIDQLILCSFYGVSKVCHLSLTFKEIIFHYKKQPQCKTQVFRNVFVDWPSTKCCGKAGQEMVDIIKFYNDVFIPAIKTSLVQLAPCSAALKNNRGSEEVDKNDGTTPGSPRPSPFTNLPDISPKKVSATHNVYVSPLRSSKMESLNSPHSKSLYACIGESTHAYQSPSKDLNVINNHLSKSHACQSPLKDLTAINDCIKSRCVNGKLDFDKPGLVSDSLVAGSLDPYQSSIPFTSNPVLSQSQSSAWTNSVSPCLSPLRRQRIGG